jgi:hypothetical protein
MNKKFIIFVLVSLVLGFFAGMEYKAYQIRSALKDLGNEISNVFGAGNLSNKEVDEMTFIDKLIGDEISLATIKLKINSFTEKQTLSGGFGSPTVAKQGTKFVVLDIDITNITNEPFNFFTNGIRLIDDKDRLFDPYSNTIGNVKNYLDTRSLAPGIVENGVFVYEIPQDSASYSFLIGKGGTSEVYRIKLK